MSLGDFLSKYREAQPNDVFEVDDEVDIFYEPTAYVLALKETNPVIHFKRVKGYENFSIVTNLFGKRERIAFALGTTIDGLYDKLNGMLDYSGTTKMYEGRAPVKEKVFLGDDINILGLPAIKHYTEDGEKTTNEGSGRYITAGLVAARNPAAPDTVNLSYARIQLLDRKRFALAMVSRRHLWAYYQSAKNKGEALPISVIVGANPAYYIATSARTENEYAKAAYVSSVGLVEGVLNDIPVPADAEVVIEAEILPSQEFEEGPFSEITGYVTGRSTNNLAVVKSVLRRNKPLFLDITPSNSAEHILLTMAARQARLIRTLNDYLPSSGAPYGFEWPVKGSSFIAFCSVAKPTHGLAKHLGLLMLGLDVNLRIVMVNEGEAPLNLERFLMNLALSLQGDSVHIIPNSMGMMLDPVATSNGTVGKAILIAKASDAQFGKSIENDGNTIRYSVDGSDAIISRLDTNTGKVNVNLGEDVNLTDSDDILWRFSTTIEPTGIRLANGKVLIKATRTNFKRPTLPAPVLQRVQDRVSSLLNLNQIQK